LGSILRDPTSPADDPEAVQRRLDELLSRERLSFRSGGVELTQEGSSCAEKVATIIRDHPTLAVKIVAGAPKPPEPGSREGLKVLFVAQEPQEPSELPLLRARSVRCFLQMSGCANPMSAQGVYDVGGGSCRLAVCSEASEAAAAEAEVEETLKEVELTFVKKPAGMRLAHRLPLQIMQVFSGGQAERLNVRTGWLVKRIGEQYTDGMSWERGVALMVKSIESLPSELSVPS